MKQSIIIFFLILLLGSCATRSLDVDYDVPTAEYGINPEPLGERLKVEISLNAHINKDVEMGGTSQSQSVFSNSPGTITIQKDNPNVGASLGLGAHGALGINQYIDLHLRKATQGLYQLGAKLCLFYNCKRDDLGWKFAIFGHAGYQSEDETSRDSWFEEKDDESKYSNVSAELSQKGHTLGYSIGYRISETLLTYFNGNFSSIEAKSEVKIAGGSTFNLDSFNESYSFLLGLRSGNDKSFIYFESGYGKIKFRGTKKREHDGLIGAMGVGVYLF